MYKMRRKTARYTISRQIQYRIKNFFTIPEAEAMLSIVKQMEGIYSHKDDEGLYTNNVKKIDPVGTAKYAEKVNEKQINPKSMHSTCIQSRSRIQST